MRLHISLDDELVAELDRRTGPRGRSQYVAAALRAAIEDDRRWDQVESVLGSIEDSGHDWDDDPSGWVAAQRHADPSRLG